MKNSRIDELIDLFDEQIPLNDFERKSLKSLLLQIAVEQREACAERTYFIARELGVSLDDAKILEKYCRDSRIKE